MSHLISSFASVFLSTFLLFSGITAARAEEPSAEEAAEQIASSAHRRPAAELRLAKTLALTDDKINAFDFSADGSRVISLDQAGKIYVWDVETEKQVVEITPADTSLGARVAISPDGNRVLFASRNGRVDLFDAKTGRLLDTDETLSAPLFHLGFSPDGRRIYACDKYGNSIVKRPQEAAEFHQGPPLTGKGPTAISMAVTGENSWLKVVRHNDKSNQWHFDGKEIRETPAPLPKLSRLISGNHAYLWTAGKDLVIGSAASSNDTTKLTLHRQKATFLTTNARFAADRQELWAVGPFHLEVRSAKDGELQGAVKIPKELTNKTKWLLPDAHMLVTNAGSQLELWHIEGNPIAVQLEIANEINRLFDQQQFAVIEELAKKWDGSVEHFVDLEHETPTTFLMNRGQEHHLADENTEQRNARYLKWIDENPKNCQFMRILMSRIYLATGYRARGGGFANTVTEDAWEIFYENMEKSWGVIEPVFENEHIPAEAYTCAIIAGKNLQWPREDVNVYLRKSVEQWPTYHRTYAEEAVARLPRWGGQPEDTARFAKVLANKVGGDDGEILYAQVARHVTRFVGWKSIVIPTGFSPTRLMKGLVLLSEKTQDEYAINQALLFAAMIQDADSAEKIIRRLLELNREPSSQLWPKKYDLIDKVYAKVVQPAAPPENAEQSQ